MKKINIKILFLIGSIALLITSTLNAQGFLKVDNKQIVNGSGQEIILRGMGLGGWMIQEGYMMQTSDFANTQHELKNKITALIGQAGMEAFYNAWLANHVREVDIDSLAKWGFNSIRLPMHYNLFTLPIEKEPVADQNTWLQKGFDLTDSLLKWCKKYQIYLILDLHAAPGGQGKDQAISDYDPSKPSLWESEQNRKKTIALWKKLAERYANEEWIGGYDLINETNWDLTGNAALYKLYKDITDSIRTVDQKHIIFIEGNWFANDFAGLTPKWDNNMVYSFHKYWTYNTKSVIQWMIDIREKYSVPIWLGESGENSNTWFKECIGLMEENKIGWAWWPMKKIGSIAGPLSVKKTKEYETLLNYWKGSVSKPTVDFATAALMQIAENLKMENCEYHPDVIDAMFRQIKTMETKPYQSVNLPGKIYATNFDLGSAGSAYYDKDIADYHLSTNTFGTWNRGWSYRNDGVDIEPCLDLANSNGYNIANTENDEWLQFTVNTLKTAAYNISIHTASTNGAGYFHFQEDGTGVCPSTNVPSTNGWQNWQIVSVNNVILAQGNHKLRLYIEKGGFNISSIEFVKVGESADIQTQFVTAKTDNDGYTVHVDINKAVTSANSSSLADFKISINGSEVPVVSVLLNPTNPRIIDIKSSYLLKAGNSVLISYTGSQITATDGTKLLAFKDKPVLNTLPKRFEIPIKIEAEDFYFNNGLNAETCTDSGAGKDLGYTDAGDYLDYLINVNESGIYAVNYRIASESVAGQIEMQLVGESTTTLHTIDLPVTGGWQNWQTATKNVQLPSGQHLLRLLIKKPGFNINWFNFDLVSSIKSYPKSGMNYHIFPNPGKGLINIESAGKQAFSYQIINISGQVQLSGEMNTAKITTNQLDISQLKSGTYLLKINSDNDIINYKIVVEN